MNSRSNNLRNRLLTIVPIVTMTLFFLCSRFPSDPAGNGAVSIALSSSYSAPRSLRSGDPLSIASIFPRKGALAGRGPQALQKTAAAAFTEARVMVLNEFNAQSQLAAAGKADFYCAMSESNVASFSGKKLDRWDDLLTGMSRFISLDLVYTGTLDKNNGFVEGDILVRTGANLVLVCFIDGNGEIVWTTGAEYIHKAEAVRALAPQSATPIVEGWQADTVWNAVTQKYDTAVWEDRQYALTPIRDSSGIFTGYILPRVGAIGYSQAYADTACSQYRRSNGGASGRVMRKIAAAGLPGQIASIPVSFSRDFYIDTTEVTQAEYLGVMGSDPSSVNGSNQPVENVSWFDAVRFCVRMSTRDHLENCYDTIAWTCDIGKNGYRLPTEAEWLLAYEAGTATKYFWGDTMDGRFLWYGLNSDGTTHPVAQKMPNKFGLYDMAGNVWEWCDDWSGGNPAQGAVDWTGPAAGTSRVLRGGQYGNYNNGTQDGTLCFSIGFRYGEAPASIQPYNGFRCARTDVSTPGGPTAYTDSVTDIDGNKYHAVTIGNQTWLVEDLRTTKYNDGSPITLDTSFATWTSATTPYYCYYNNSTDADSIKKFGALYNGYVVNPANVKKIAPAGWHVPSDAEWDTLQNYLIAKGYNWDKTTDSNKIAKSLTAKTDWLSDTATGTPGNNLTTNNSSGFSAMPGGYRNGSGFCYRSISCAWWSVTASGATSAWVYTINYNNTPLYRVNCGNFCGFSVRLVRD